MTALGAEVMLVSLLALDALAAVGTEVLATAALVHPCPPACTQSNTSAREHSSSPAYAGLGMAGHSLLTLLD